VGMKTRLVATAAICLSLSWTAPGFAQETRIGKLVGNAKRGKALYTRYCIFCHGPFGYGCVASAPFFDPKPRDFTLAVFMCRSTPSGTLPL